MSHSTMTIRRRTAGLVGALAIVGTTGVGLASGADAASSTQASSTLAAIKQCESGGNYQAQNPVSTASGAYQMLDTTWRSLHASKGYAKAKYAPKAVQDAAAVELYNQMGTSPWASSSHCWAK